MQRRHVLPALLCALAASPATWAQGKTTSPDNRVQVWKDPNCGCCKDWIRHMQTHGFVLNVIDSGNNAARKRLGMPEQFGSCHTALVQGYVLEGHVPAADVRRLLAQRPDALGLSVPRMPVGSPGMDGPEYGGRKDPFDVLLIGRDGSASVYASYPAHTATPALPMAQGEVRRVDARAGKVTLKHGDIPNLDMPPMTMVFTVRDPSQLNGLQAGDRVRFSADLVNGNYTVLNIERLQ